MKWCQFIVLYSIMAIFTIFSIGLSSSTIDGNIPLGKQELRSKGIFGSLRSILDYIKQPKYGSLPAIKEMLKKYRKSLHIGRQLTDFLPGPRRRFIVIEGLYTSKRNAVAKLLARIMGGKHILNPYRKMAGVSLLPTTYDTRRAYYSLTKYGIANLVPKLLSKQAVIMERYWLDQATFAIAKTFGSKLPPLDSGLYDWPSDLLKPDITFFINADRKSTDGFTLPNDINNFTLNIIEAYKQFKKKIPIVEISSDQLLMSMAKEIMSQIRLLGPDVVRENEKVELLD